MKRFWRNLGKRQSDIGKDVVILRLSIILFYAKIGISVFRVRESFPLRDKREEKTGGMLWKMKWFPKILLSRS